MTAYYNENDPVAAEWLRRLIARGLIAPGEVDERDIRDVAPAELVRFTQCHFFAGIGIWSLALRRAGWSDDRPIWTGSCPCQPFSTAGAGQGFDDERHLWPAWFWLIDQCRPVTILGEQVASKDGLWWNDLVSSDLDGIGYAFGSVVTCAAGFGMEWRGSAESERLERAIRLCPDPMVARHMASFADWADSALGFGGFHIRERQYFVGLSNPTNGDGWTGERRAQAGVGPDGERGQRSTGGCAHGGVAHGDSHGRKQARPGVSTPRHDGPQRNRPACRMVDGICTGLEGLGEHGPERDEPGRVGAEPDRSAAPAGPACGLGDGEGRGRRVGGDALGPGACGHADSTGDPPVGLADADNGMGASPNNSRRGDLDWLFCRDGEWRPVGSGAFPLVDATPARVGRLRAYGNGLDTETATEFCRAVIDLIEERAR